MTGEQLGARQLGLTYESAMVHYPGTFAEVNTIGPFAVGNRLDFLMNDHFVIVRLPTGIWEVTRIKEKFVKPMVEVVSRDISTIDALLPELHALARQGKAPQDLMYSPDTDSGSDYRVYDTFPSPPGKIFDVLFEIKGVPEYLLDPSIRDLVPLAQEVGKDENGLVHVRGRNLVEAVSLAYRIYSVGDRLREIRDGIAR